MQLYLQLLTILKKLLNDTFEFKTLFSILPQDL